MGLKKSELKRIVTPEHGEKTELLHIRVAKPVSEAIAKAAKDLSVPKPHLMREILRNAVEDYIGESKRAS